MQGEVLQEQLAYWRTQLEGAPTALDLPTDRTRPAVPSGTGGHVVANLSPDLLERLKLLSRQEGVTLYMTLLAAFANLLARYSRQQEVLVGTPIANRNRVELEDLVGFLTNTLVLRLEAPPECSFRRLLASVRETVLGAEAHQDLPFELLVEELNPPRDRSRAPLFQVMFAFHNSPDTTVVELPGARIEGIPLERGTTKFDLSLFMRETPDGLRGTFEYSTDLFERETIERMQAHFLCLLEAAVAEPDRRIDELPLLREAERDRMIQAWSGSAAAYPVSCLHERFEARAAATPDAPAVTYEGEVLPDRELNERANRLAHRLREHGVGPEVPVALCLHRSLELVVSVIAVLKAGGAYVPLDPDYPSERLAFVLEDARPPALITQEDLLSRLPAHQAAVVCLERESSTLDDLSSANPEPLARPENLAYIIYTSGSTGQPKGVQVEHRNVTRLFSATDDWFAFGPDEIWTLFHSYAFDFSVWELWGALLYGGRLVVPSSWTTRSPQAFTELLVEEQVTVLNATPTLFASVQDELIRGGRDLALPGCGLRRRSTPAAGSSAVVRTVRSRRPKAGEHVRHHRDDRARHLSRAVNRRLRARHQSDRRAHTRPPDLPARHQSEPGTAGRARRDLRRR